MLIGYARVSTQDQNLELQREALTKAGCQKVFEDKVSGTRAKRPGLDKALEMVRSGDVLVVWKLCGVKHKLALLPSFALFHEVPHHGLFQKCGKSQSLTYAKGVPPIGSTPFFV
ncbi:hypothetical protein ECAE60S_01499 [Eoetvoesiella caeni]